MSKQVVEQPRTAIIEAAKIVLERVHHKNACAQCTLGMLLDELGFQEYEFVAAGIGLSCIYATKTTINWDVLMTAIEVKRSKKKEEELQNNRVEDCPCPQCVIQRGGVISDVKDEELLVREVMQSLHEVGISLDDIKARLKNQRPYWLNEALKTEIKRSSSLPPVTNVKSPQERAHWLNEALKTGRSEEDER